MVVTLNPNISYKTPCSFKNKPKDFGPIDEKLPRDELIIKRTKDVLFSSVFALIGVNVLYFCAQKQCRIAQRAEGAMRRYLRTR